MRLNPPPLLERYARLIRSLEGQTIRDFNPSSVLALVEVAKAATVISRWAISSGEPLQDWERLQAALRELDKALASLQAARSKVEGG
jgi:hypothetical protein